MNAPVIGSVGEAIDLLIRQGATFGPHQVTLTNPDGTPVNLTGATVRGQIRRTALSTGSPLADLAVTIIDAPNGVFEFGLSSTQTAALGADESPQGHASRAVWDMELQDTLGRVIPLFTGKVNVYREVTR